MRATAPPPPGGAPGPGSARRAAAIASPGNAERPAGSGRLPAAQPPPRPAEARGAGPLAEGLRRAAWQVDAGWGEKGAPPPSACAPRGCFHRTAAGSTGRPGGGNAPHTAVALCWPGASGGSCSPAGAVRGRRGGGVGVGGEHPLASRTAALLCRGPHPAGARPAATGKGYGAPPAASPARRHGAGTRPRRSPQGGPGELGAEAEPDEAILTGEGWQGCAARGAAVDGATSPSVPAFSGPCRFSRAFPLTAGLFRLPVLAQRCPPPRPSCSHPPARGRRARCLGSPPHGSASLGCPRTPPPPPGALLGLRATICTGECTPPHVPVRPVSSQGEALPPCSTSPFSGLRRLRGPTRGRSSC